MKPLISRLLLVGIDAVLKRCTVFSIVCLIMLVFHFHGVENSSACSMCKTAVECVEGHTNNSVHVQGCGIGARR